MRKGKARGSKAHIENQPQDQSFQQIAHEVDGEREENAAASGADESAEEEPLYDAAKIVNRPAYDTKHLDKLRYNVPELSE